MPVRPGPSGLILLIFLVGMFFLPSQIVFAQGIPSGFRLIAEQPGVALYRKDYAGGSPDYVQVIDLAAGASLDLLYGDPVAMDNSHNQGMFGGPNPSFRQKTIRGYWDSYSSSQDAAFCVANGQFFYMPESPTPLALPLLVEHQLLAEGFGYPQYPEKQLVLALWPDHADILPLTPENLASTSAESVIGGLTEEANKKPKNAVGRTFIGIWDRDGDQHYEMVAIYTTQTATQAEAAQTVRSFGASKVMMLDGGGSTQLICQGQTYIDTTRAIPQALGVSAGLGVPLAPISRPPASQSASPLSIEPSTATEESQGAEDMPQPITVQDSVADPNLTATQPATPNDQLQEAPPAEPLDPAAGAISSLMPTSTFGMVEPIETQAGPGMQKEIIGDLASGRPVGIAQQYAGAGTVNGADVLLLPVIIPPLSVILIVLARRQIFLLYRDG